MNIITMEQALALYSAGKDVKVIYTNTDWEGSTCSTLRKELDWLLGKMIFLAEEDVPDGSDGNSSNSSNGGNRSLEQAKGELLRAESKRSEEKSPEEKLFEDLMEMESQTPSQTPSNPKPVKKPVVSRKKRMNKLDFDYDRATEMRDSGMSYGRIATELGCSEGSVYNYLKGGIKGKKL